MSFGNDHETFLLRYLFQHWLSYLVLVTKIKLLLTHSSVKNIYIYIYIQVCARVCIIVYIYIYIYIYIRTTSISHILVYVFLLVVYVSDKFIYETRPHST